MSSRPMSSVREVLESIAGTVKTTVEDLTGETERLRNQIAINKQAMQATLVRADGVKPILPAYETLITAYGMAKADFAKIEHAPDPRPALAAQQLLRTAADDLAAVRDEHDRQFAARAAYSSWADTHGVALDQALEAKDLGPSLVKPHADLLQANKPFAASLGKPDYVEAAGLRGAVEARLTEFVRLRSEAEKPNPQKSVRDAVTSGHLAAKLKEPVFLKQITDWMETADPADPAQRADMLAVLKAMDPAQQVIRQKAFEQTFKTKIGKSEKRTLVPKLLKNGKPSMYKGKAETSETLEENVPLDPAALDAMADIMAQFPAAHMPKLWMLEGHNRDKGSNGSYNDLTDEAQFVFSLTDIADGLTQKYTNCTPGDPLENAKAFDVMVRHECGHKAAAVAGSEELTNSPDGGAWVHHDTADKVLTALDSEFQEFVRVIQKGSDKPTAVDIRKQVLNAQNYFSAFSIAEALKLPEDRVPEHLVLQILVQGSGNRFNCGSSPVSANGRMYVMGGPGTGSWFSFDKSAWDKRVSLYQYAAPNEWFAEFYATANNGEESVREAAKSRYPDAWKWLKKNHCIVVGV